MSQPNPSPSSPHPNVALAERAWHAVSQSDIDGLRAILAPDVVWHATGRNPWAGDHHGFDAVLDYLALVGELTDTFDARLDDVLVSSTHTHMLFHVVVGRGAVEVGVDYQLLARVEEGRVTEVWTAPLDPAAIERFWSRVETN